MLVVLLAGGIGLAAAGLSGGASVRRGHSGLAARSRLAGRRVAVGAGIGVIRPHGWHLMRPAALTYVESPVPRLAMASWRDPRPGGGVCDTPGFPIAYVPSTGAFVLMWEYPGVPRWARSAIPLRPRRFALGRKSYKPYAGADGPYAGGNKLLRDTLGFRDAGRWFQIELYIGARASESTIATLAAVLDSLSIGTRSSAGTRG